MASIQDDQGNQRNYNANFPDGNVSAGMLGQAPNNSGPYDVSKDMVTAQPSTNQATAPNAGAQSQMPSGIDPRLAALYQKSGVTPGGAGSGFADWQYWQDKANSSGDWDYFTNRLGNDLAGKGTDQPTGTPGQGAWMNSGTGGGLGAVANTVGSIMGSSSTTGQTPPYTFLNQPAYQFQQTPNDSNLFNTLMGRANQSLNVSPNDPVIKAQTDAYRAEQGRGVKDYLSSAAEKGGQNANLDAASRSGYEKAAQNTGALQASLMGNELNARRQEITQALQEGGAMLSQQDQLALQRELGSIDAAIRDKSTNNQYSLGLGQLGLGHEQLNSNNDQFAANYNLNATGQANYWDAIRRGLT